MVPWRGEGTPFAEPVEAAIGLLAASTYGAQRERLVGNGVAVPVVQLVREGGRAFTVATWSPQDRATWLPEVDVIDVSGVGRVAWSDVLRFARGALERLPIEPVRYSARWPSPATLEAMRAVSVR